MAAPRPTVAAPRPRAGRGLGAPLRVVAVLAPLLSSSPGPLRAQQWAAAVDGGRATFDLGSREIETSNLVLSLVHARPHLWFGGSVSPALAGDDPLWGGAWVAAFPERARGRWRGAVNLGAQLYGQDDPLGQSSGMGAGGELIPQLSYEVSPAVQLGVAAGGQVYYSGFGADSTAFTRTVGVAEGFAIAAARGSPLEFLGTVRHLFAEEDGYTLLQASAQATTDRVAGWASVGAWLNEFIDTTPWEVGGAVRVTDRAWVRAGIREEAFDPLYLSDDRTTWSVGVSVQLGGRATDRIAEASGLPASVQPASGAELSVPGGTGVAPISVAGDFTDWQVVPMRLDGDTWVYRAALAPGVYHYAFVDGDGSWFVPEGTPGRTDDGMGGWVAVLIVDE